MIGRCAASVSGRPSAVCAPPNNALTASPLGSLSSESTTHQWPRCCNAFAPASMRPDKSVGSGASIQKHENRNRLKMPMSRNARQYHLIGTARFVSVWLCGRIGFCSRHGCNLSVWGQIAKSLFKTRLCIAFPDLNYFICKSDKQPKNRLIRIHQDPIGEMRYNPCQ